MNVFLTEFM